MEKIKPYLRWLAVGIAGLAAVLAYVAPHRSDQPASADDSPPPQPAVAATATTTAAPTAHALAVYVVGATKNAGVFELPQGSRVVDAVNKAGGLTKDADAESINLAEPLVDGMKIDIPKK